MHFSYALLTLRATSHNSVKKSRHIFSCMLVASQRRKRSATLIEIYCGTASPFLFSLYLLKSLPPCPVSIIIITGSLITTNNDA